MRREYKSVPFAAFTKDGLGPRTRAGIFSVLGNRDSAADRVLPGAFTKSLRENGSRARHLWNHDFASPPTAKVEDIYEISQADLPEAVLRHAPDALGAMVVVRTYLDTPRDNEVLAALDAGAVDKMSFAFDVPPGRAEHREEVIGGEKVMTRFVHEVRHYESSDVLFGANGATLATLALPHPALALALKALAAEVKAGRRGPDDEAVREILTLAGELAAPTEPAGGGGRPSTPAPLDLSEFDAKLSGLKLAALECAL